jgi:hypothetical protein
MKKIISLSLVSVLLSATALAQTRSEMPLRARDVLGDARVTLSAVPAAVPRKVLLRASFTPQTGAPTAKRDGLANGIWIGLLVGLGVGAATIPIVCPNDDECQNVYAVVIVPIYAAGGAVVGALIDRAITEPQQTAHVSLGHSRVGVSTSARRGQRSVALDVSF